MRGSLEAFWEERSPGPSPAGKRVSWVCLSVCCSPDSRPQHGTPMANGVHVGADGGCVLGHQEPKGKAGGWGAAVGGWSA